MRSTRRNPHLPARAPRPLRDGNAARIEASCKPGANVRPIAYKEIEAPAFRAAAVTISRAFHGRPHDTPAGSSGGPEPRSRRRSAQPAVTRASRQSAAAGRTAQQGPGLSERFHSRPHSGGRHRRSACAAVLTSCANTSLR
ncbi:protein of unknown function [Burkholderia multivorans]